MRDPHEIAADIKQLDFWDYNLYATAEKLGVQI